MHRSFGYTTGLHRNRVYTNYLNLWKVRAFLRPPCFGRMDITRFQTVTCGEFHIALYPQIFSKLDQTDPWPKIPFQRRLKSPHRVARLIFALWHTLHKNVSFARFAMVDEFGHISFHYEEIHGPFCGCQWKTVISLTHTKISAIRACREMNESDDFVIVQSQGCFGPINCMFGSYCPWYSPRSVGSFFKVKILTLLNVFGAVLAP